MTLSAMPASISSNLLPHLLKCSDINAHVRQHAQKIEEEKISRKRKRYGVRCTPERCICTCRQGEHAEEHDDATRTTSYPHVTQDEFQMMVARVFYTCLIAFSVVERAAFIELFAKIRPDLLLPSRHHLAGSLLARAYEACQQAVMAQIKHEKNVSMVSDGWSDPKGASIVNAVVPAPGMRSMLWASVATGANARAQSSRKRLKTCRGSPSWAVWSLTTPQK